MRRRGEPRRGLTRRPQRPRPWQPWDIADAEADDAEADSAAPPPGLTVEARACANAPAPAPVIIRPSFGLRGPVARGGSGRAASSAWPPA